MMFHTNGFQTTTPDCCREFPMSSFSLAAIEDKRLSSTAHFPRVWRRWLCHFNDYHSNQLFDSRMHPYLAVFTQNKNPAYNFFFGKCCDTAKVHTWKRDMAAKLALLEIWIAV